MNKILQIIADLRNTTSTNEKKAILEQNKDNDLLKKILLYTYDPFKKYGVSEKVLKTIIEEGDAQYLPSNLDLFKFLDKVYSNNINNELRKQIGAYISCAEDKFAELLKCIFLKDLKAGINVSLINKVWKKLIPKFEVQLARKYQDVRMDDKELIFITEKLDGVRCVIIKNGNVVKLFTRQGKEINGLIEIEKDVLTTFCGVDIVLDGELLAINTDNLDSGDLYRKTTKIVNSKSQEKLGVVYNVFDIMPIKDFVDGQSTKIYKHRRQELESICFCGSLKLVPLLYAGCDHSMIPKLLTEVEEQGKEGLMINRNVHYQCKRTNGLLKVKTMHTVDLRVLGVEEGQGNFINTLGAIIVEYKNNKVKVGSGFSLEERMNIWADPQSIIGKIVEVQYFEESTNEQGGVSLRFPVFKWIRNDKNEPSYN